MTAGLHHRRSVLPRPLLRRSSHPLPRALRSHHAKVHRSRAQYHATCLPQHRSLVTRRDGRERRWRPLRNRVHGEPFRSAGVLAAVPVQQRWIARDEAGHQLGGERKRGRWRENHGGDELGGYGVFVGEVWIDYA